MGKINGQYLLFSYKFFIYLNSLGNLYLNYQSDDYNYFLSFSTKTKKFCKESGFGRSEKDRNPDWWKDSSFRWKEMRR